MTQRLISLLMVTTLSSALLLALNGCSRSSSSNSTSVDVSTSWDRSCDLAAYPSVQWTQCETSNYAKYLAAPLEQLSPVFAQRLLEQSAANEQTFLQRALGDPSWLSPLSGNTAALPYCGPGVGPCVGDPFRYPSVDGADGKQFYEQQAQVEPVVFYDDHCARLSGHVWRPRNASGRLPAVVFDNGSVGAAEQQYWWIVQPLVRAGYMVLTYDPRGQGLSDFAAPLLQLNPAGPVSQLGTNANPQVFWTDLVNALDFLLSSPDQLYPHNLSCVGTYPTQVTPNNPFYANLDPQRIGVAGHSYGAAGVTIVQAYGAVGADAWPGKLSTQNPVKAIVAMDGLGYPGAVVTANGANFCLPCGGYIAEAPALGNFPPIVARVPALGFNSEYGIVGTPFLSPPDPDAQKNAYDFWRNAGQPVFEIVVAASAHQDYSLLPGLPGTSWCPQVVDNACVGGWGRPLNERYTVAWFDRWLKKSGEPGYGDADARLLDDGSADGAAKMSFHFHSARSFPDRNDQLHHCENIRAGCAF